MMRVRPPDEAIPCARPNRSTPATRSPRRASASAAADPWAPSPMTTASTVSIDPSIPPSLRPDGFHPVEDQPLDVLQRHPLLRHRVAVADGDGTVVERVHVHGHAPRRPDLVLAPVQLPDRRRVVVHG